MTAPFKNKMSRHYRQRAGLVKRAWAFAEEKGAASRSDGEAFIGNDGFCKWHALATFGLLPEPGISGTRVFRAFAHSRAEILFPDPVANTYQHRQLSSATPCSIMIINRNSKIIIQPNLSGLLTLPHNFSASGAAKNLLIAASSSRRSTWSDIRKMPVLCP